MERLTLAELLETLRAISCTAWPNCGDCDTMGFPCRSALERQAVDYLERFSTADNKRPATNADRIRAMSDEELAEWLGDTDACPPDVCTHIFDDVDCPECLLDWLRQEAEQ